MSSPEKPAFEDVPWAGSGAARPVSVGRRVGCGFLGAVFAVAAGVAIFFAAQIARQRDLAAAQLAKQRESAALEEKFSNPIGSLTADKLLKLFEANEVAAAKFVGAVLVVTGTVNTILDDGNGGSVGLGRGLIGSVRASFDKDRREEVSRLKKGDTVVVVGLVDGLTIARQVTLRSCRVR